MAESAAGAASEVAGWVCVAATQEQLLSRMVTRAVVANAEPVPSKTVSKTWHPDSSSMAFAGGAYGYTA